MSIGKRLAIVFVILLLLPLFALGGAAVYLFYVHPCTNFNRLPVAEGAKGLNFEVRAADGTPYLWSYGLPYPTDYESSNHESQSLNGNWKIKFDPEKTGENDEWHKLKKADDSWNDTLVPSNYNTASGDKTSYEGLVWYMLKFESRLPEDKDRFVRLTFRGVLLRSKVWLNGTLLGSREGGYTPFYFNATKHLLKEGPNVLVVKTDNRLTETSLPCIIRDDHSPGWHTYGGIYRDVYLESIPQRYVFKTVIQPSLDGETGSFMITILTHNLDAPKPYTLECTLTGPGSETVDIQTLQCDGTKEVMKHYVTFTVDDPRPWSFTENNLYTLDLALDQGDSVQRVSYKTGLRTITTDKTDILLNGREIFLAGISKHEDDPELGAVQTAASINRDLALIKGMNANYIRMSHYPHAVQELRKARDMGLLFSEEIPLYQAGVGFTAWYNTKKILEFPASRFGTKQTYNRTMITNAQRELIELIERDRNNPALIFWGAGNECYTLFENGIRPFRWLREVAKSFDPTRPVTNVELTYDIPFFDDRRMSGKYMDILSVNTYFGWYYNTIDALGPKLDRVHELYPDVPIILSEYGASAGPGRRESDGDWKAERVPPGKTYSEDYQAKLHQGHWEQIVERDYFAGQSPWIFSDFYNVWFPSNPIPNYNLKGVTTRYRKPKMAYYVLKENYAGVNETGYTKASQ